MTLEKASIQRKIPKGDPINVLFNPKEYRITTANQFAEVAIPGMAAPALQFTRGNARILSMQLFFDTYEQGEDVRNHTGKVMELMEIDPELHAPPVCIFSWGDLNFVGVLERADQRFTLFLSDGTPVRASMDVSFKEYFDGDNQSRKLRSANFAKLYVVHRGDTLSAIAGDKYGDPENWRPIAEENSIDDPLSIQPGDILVIPAIE